MRDTMHMSRNGSRLVTDDGTPKGAVKILEERGINTGSSNCNV